MTTMTEPDPLLVQAVRFLAGRCDGAQTEDGVGYNGTDTHFGRSLATVPPDAWSPEVAREAWAMLRKYRGQLDGAGINFDAITEPPAPEEPKASGKKIRIVDYDPDAGVIVKIPFGDECDPKWILGAKWDKPNKRWICSPARWEKVLPYAEECGLAVSASARGFLSSPQEVEIPPIGTVDVEDAIFTLQFDYDPAAVADVKGIPGRAWNAAGRLWTAPLTSVRAVREFAKTHRLTLTPAAEAVQDAEPLSGPQIDVAGGEFILRFDYDRDLVARVRDLPGARWSAPKRAWTVDLEAAIEVTEFAVATEAHINASAVDVLADAQEALRRIEQSAATDAEITIPGLGGDLLPFQRAGVLYALRAMGYRADDSGQWIPE